MNAVGGLEHIPQDVPWQQCRLFHDLPPAALAAVGRRLSSHDHAAGAILFREGEAADRLYVVLSGQLEVLIGADLMPVAQLEPGEHFGEMGLLSAAPRAATIRAAGPCRVVALDRAALESLRQEDGVDILAHAMRLQADTLDMRLRDSNARAADGLRSLIRAQQERLAFGRVFANIILVMFVYISSLDVLRRLAAHGASTTLVSSGLLLGMAAASWLIVRYSGFPREAFGLTLRNWRHSLIDGLGWSVVFCAALTALKAVLVTVVPAYQGMAVIAPWVSPAGVGATVSAYLLYAVLSPVQEFVARGAIQGSLQQMLTGPEGGGWKAVVLASAIFSISHQHLGLGYALAVFLPGLFWGWMYLRHGSLIGVSVSHVVIGLWVTGVLDIAALTAIF
ncbi:cyclic nucleotide-binding domain-containing protein [Caenispirillum bisanense]|uniref:cyclic nucleotide-binding domain-containing protein n=1 Tax=Caenispirillum bisanense TaxID=414052 RepID=UPI0031CDEAB5